MDMTPRLCAAAIGAAATLLVTACQQPEPAAPPQPYGAMPSPGQYTAPAGGVAGAQSPVLGPALTPFGFLGQLPSLPQLPAQWPAQLPDLGSWMGTNWPFPQGQPQPQPPPPRPHPQPQPQPQQQVFPLPGMPAMPGFPIAPPGGSTAQEDEVLQLTNQRRAQGANCGGKVFGPAGPLAPNTQLQAAARGHSRDMASRGYFAHQSPEGSGPSERARAAGYQSGFVGENIAAGYPTPAAVVEGWMASPGHCLNIMEPRYRYLGVGHHAGSKQYWTQNFGG